ncbi:MAG: CDP-alcohol phosphatidyltransferase family protein [Phycisphaerae bacterium]
MSKSTMIQREEQPVTETRKRRLIGISLLPATATLGNLLCGFLAIFCCLLSIRAGYAEMYAEQPRVFSVLLEKVFPTHIAAGAYLIVLAMIFDALDGRLARITRRTSEFGAQLDSLSDIVSFGVAPMALFITLLMRPGPDVPVGMPDFARVLFRVGMLGSLIYLSCAAIRLARYNAENVRSEHAQPGFSGLPSPGAAAAVAALLALHENLRDSEFAAWGVDWLWVLRWATAVTTVVVGLLMVGRVDYVHVFNLYVRRKHPPTHLVWVIVIVVLGFYSFPLLLVCLAFAYVLSGLLLHAARRLGWSWAEPPKGELELPDEH